MIYYKKLKKELERLHGKRAGLALLAAALTLLLSGCFVKTVDELYTLPRHSDEYDRLELAIDAVLSGQSAAYSGRRCLAESAVCAAGRSRRRRTGRSDRVFEGGRGTGRSEPASFPVWTAITT